jgi:hypothetical protein
MSAPPRGLFKGKNIMTPDVLAYYNLGNGRWAELSEGRGINRQPIFGVTVRPEPVPVQSKLCQSRAEAVRYIDGLMTMPATKPIASGASRAEWLDPTNLDKLRRMK